MTTPRTRLWPLAMLAAIAVFPGCDTFTGPDAGMRLSGRVTDSMTGGGIQGARVVLTGQSPYTYGTLGSAITDASGHYSVRVSTPPGYVEVNCSVIAVSVSATGYVPVEGTLSWFASCSTGAESATADFELTPVEPEG